MPTNFIAKLSEALQPHGNVHLLLNGLESTQSLAHRRAPTLDSLTELAEVDPILALVKSPLFRRQLTQCVLQIGLLRGKFIERRTINAVQPENRLIPLRFQLRQPLRFCQLFR